MKFTPGCCCNPTSFSGTLVGCTNGGIPGTVAIVDASTMATLWTGSTNGSGVYSGSVLLAANTAVTITGTPTSGRFAATPRSATLIRLGTNTGLNIQAAAATGFVCTNACNFPLFTTLTLTSSGTCAGIAYPSDTLTYQSLPSWLASALGVSSAWVGATTWAATYAGTTGNWTYVWFVNASGQLRLRAAELTQTAQVALATPTLGVCSGSATTPAFTSSTSCAIQGIGSTINE